MKRQITALIPPPTNLLPPEVAASLLAAVFVTLRAPGARPPLITARTARWLCHSVSPADNVLISYSGSIGSGSSRSSSIGA